MYYFFFFGIELNDIGAALPQTPTDPRILDKIPYNLVFICTAQGCVSIGKAVRAAAGMSSHTVPDW